MACNNIFKNIPQHFPSEICDDLISGKAFSLKRIVSQGHTSPEKGWYDQDNDEWVILRSGKATVLFAENNRTVELVTGDYLHIKAHQQHKVTFTDPQTPSVWLCLFFSTA